MTLVPVDEPGFLVCWLAGRPPSALMQGSGGVRWCGATWLLLLFRSEVRRLPCSEPPGPAAGAVQPRHDLMDHPHTRWASSGSKGCCESQRCCTKLITMADAGHQAHLEGLCCKLLRANSNSSKLSLQGPQSCDQDLAAAAAGVGAGVGAGAASTRTESGP